MGWKNLGVWVAEGGKWWRVEVVEWIVVVEQGLQPLPPSWLPEDVAAPELVAAGARRKASLFLRRVSDRRPRSLTRPLHVKKEEIPDRNTGAELVMTSACSKFC